MMVWADPDTAGEAVTVTVPSQAALLSDLQDHLKASAGFAVATINLDHVVKLRRDSAFRKAYRQHTHVTADGNPIVWMEHLAGRSDVELTTGSDLILPLAKIAAATATPVAFFGATEAALSGAKEALGENVPDLDVVLTLAPPMGFDPEGSGAQDAISQIRDSGARLVFLALGAPKQERFAAFALSLMPEAGFVSIGAGLDFLAGHQQRAPQWMQRLALEWLWRLLKSPGRLAGRYAACAWLLPGLVTRALIARRKTTR